MSFRHVILPAGLALALLAGCSGTPTATAEEQSVGFDANAKACHKSCEGLDKAACEAKLKEVGGDVKACEKTCEKDKAGSTTNG